MDNFRAIIASNLIKLRTNAGMTQAELGEKLNYSDKTISKWERAEAIPDVLVLKRLSEIYGIGLDDLLSASDGWKPKPEGIDALPQEKREELFRPSMVMLVSFLGVWTLAVLIFVIFWVIGSLQWIVFAAAVPASLTVLLVLNTIWYQGKYNLPIVAALVFSLIAVVYLALKTYHPWQLFLVVVPAELIVFLSFRIRKHSKGA